MADATTRGTGRYRLRPRESEAPDAEQILRRWQTLRSRRANVDEVQQELADYIIPRKAVITEHHGGAAVGRVEGEELTEHVWDSTAIRANELLAARIQGALTSPSIRWFSLKTRDARMNEQYAVRRWLNDVEDRMYLALRQSNFNAEMGEVYLDLGALGTGAMLIESEETDEGNRGFWFRALAPGTYCIAEDSRGRVDTLFRILKMTLRQCAQQFSVDALPAAWREQLDREPDAEREVLHAIQSRRVDNPRRKDVLHFPVASVYLAISEKVILEEGGYKEFPGVVPRWSKTSGEVYGRGPGHTALPDIRTLNKAVELTLSSAAKALDPPGLVSSDATIAELDLRPGSMNTVEGDPRLAWAPLESGAKFDVSKLLEGDLRESIRNTFYWDQLQLQSQRVMTACVPLYSEALTPQGWKRYDELYVGGTIMAYSLERNRCEWTTIDHLYVHEAAPTYLYCRQSYRVVATADHKWVVRSAATSVQPVGPWMLRSFDDLPGFYCDLLQSAPMEDGKGLEHPLAPWDLLRRESLVGQVMAMSSRERQTFIMGVLAGEGSFHHQRGHTHGFIYMYQNIGYVLDAFRLACQLEGIATSEYLPYAGRPTPKDGWPRSQARRITLMSAPHRAIIPDWIGRRAPTRRGYLRRYDAGVQPVWCPSTPLKTWVMRQGTTITITGNTEVQSRLEIMQQFLAPTLARLESEALTPLLNRCFSIMHRQGELPPPPEELARGANLDVEYEGPLARSQKVTRLAGMDEFIRITAPVAQQQPAVVDNLDTDRAFRDLAEVAGLPADYLRDEDDVATMRQQRAQQQQLAKQMEVAMGASEMGRNLAPVMEAAQGIPPDQMAGAAGGGGNPLEMLQGMMSGQNGAAGPPR
jgi:hypothetical protein